MNCLRCGLGMVKCVPCSRVNRSHFCCLHCPGGHKLCVRSITMAAKLRMTLMDYAERGRVNGRQLWDVTRRFHL